MKCRRCNQDLPDDSIYCSSCGSKQDVPPIIAEIFYRGKYEVTVYCFNGRHYMDNLYNKIKLKFPKTSYSSIPHSYDSQYGQFSITYGSLFASLEEVNYIGRLARTYFLDNGFEEEDQSTRIGENITRKIFVKRDY